MLNIHDIKPLAEVPDYSIYFYYGIIILVSLLFIFILYMIYHFIQKKRNSQRKEYFKILQQITFDNPKQDAYTITTYGRLLATDERSKKLMGDLYESLHHYKYKKEISESFSKDTKVKFETFMDSIDV
jgi:hypothetical protein